MTFRGRPLTDAIIDVLEGTGHPVGDAIAPDDVGWQGAPGASTFVPYIVVFPVTGGTFDGPISAPFADGRPDYIVHAYGATRAQCQLVADAVHARLTAVPPSLSGQTFQLASPDVDGGVVRDDDVTPPIFYSPSRWRMFVTS